MIGLPSETHRPHLTRPSARAENPSSLSRALKIFDAPEVSGEFGGEEGARLFQAARLLITHKEFAPAQQLLRKTLSLAPWSVVTIKALAECAFGLGQTGEGVKLLQALVRISDHPDHLVRLADALYDLGQDQEALRYYLSALRTLDESAPQLFEIYKTMGNIFVRSRDFDSAEDNYNKAYRLNPHSAILRVNFGTLEIQRGNWDAAVQRLREAIVLDPSCDRAWVGLAITHRQFGDHQLSWANLARALDHNPMNTTALQLALSWVVKDERWEQVTQWLVAYLSRNGEDSLMSLALAQLWFLRGRHQNARVELERTLALDPHVEGGADLLALIEEEEMKGSHGGDGTREGHGSLG